MRRESVGADLSGIGILVTGVTPAVADGLRESWSGFLAATVADPWLVVTVEDVETPLTAGREMKAGSATAREGAGVRAARDEGGATIDAASGRAHVRLASGDDRRRIWGLINLVHAALGFVLDRRGGAILHAAGIVVDGRAFVLIGAEGAGKTTFARAAAEAGVPVLSDDQVLVVTDGGRCEAVAAPIRNRDFPGPGRGRWPVASFLLPVHGPKPSLAPVPRIEVSSRLAANRLYVASTPGASFGPGDALDRLSEGAPARKLTFAPDASFLELLRAFSA